MNSSQEFLVRFFEGLVFFLLVFYFLSFFDGWRGLTKYYRSSSKFEGEVWRWARASIGGGLWPFNSMILGANSHGLYMATIFPLSISHPPLFIPWSKVTACSGMGFFGPQVRFFFLDGPNVDLRTGKAMAGFLERASRGGLAIDAL